MIRVLVPYHITGFWYPVYRGDPYRTGSLGAGLVLGTYLEAYPCERGVRDPVVNRVLALLGVKQGVCFREPRPVGVGYGASAARSLAASLLVGASRGLSFCRAAQEAHRAEVELGTGLGDVIAESVGIGLVYRVAPGAPCIGLADYVVPKGRLVVVTAPMGRMATPAMLREYASRIARLGREAYRGFMRNPSLEGFLEHARRFSRGVGFLTQELEERIQGLLRRYLAQGSIAGLYVKKRLLVVVVDPSDAEEVAEVLRRGLGSDAFIDPISSRGPAIEWSCGDGRCCRSWRAAGS